MMSHRYLFALMDAGGNVPPELSAVRRLVGRGHAVTVLADDSSAAEVRSTGAELRRWICAPNRLDRRPESDLSCDWECKFPWQLINRAINTLLIGPARGSADDVFEAIAKCRPELVVCSMFCLGGMVAAQGSAFLLSSFSPMSIPFPRAACHRLAWASSRRAAPSGDGVIELSIT